MGRNRPAGGGHLPLQNRPGSIDKSLGDDTILCLGCGNEILDGEDCPICAAGVAVRRAPAKVEQPRTRLCAECGNDVLEGDDCPVCAMRPDPAYRTPPPAEEPDEPEAVAPPEEAEEPRTTLCTGCGNDIVVGEACPVCDAARAQQERAREKRTQLCPSCGNEVPADEACPICQSGRAVSTRKRKMTICRDCGNEVPANQPCAICAAGRGSNRAKEKKRQKGAVCPQCDDHLEAQDWDGVKVLICPSCQGCLFPHGGLERTLDKLRDSAEPASLREALDELRQRPGASLPRTVRYKQCPVCGLSMTRRVYADVSGVIIDMCGTHGRWVDQTSFSAITDFVTRGGDLLAKRNPLRRPKR